MNISQHINDPTKIDLGAINELKTPDGRIFFARSIMVFTENGLLRIDLSSDDKKSLEVVL